MVLASYKRLSQRDGKARTFNQTRALCQSFLANSYGIHHPFWMEVSNVRPLPVAPKYRGRARSFVEVRQLMHEEDSVYTRMFWIMCVTGMGPTELYGDWEVQHDRVLIHGTKRIARDRMVLLLDPKIRREDFPTLKYFRKAMKRLRPDWLLYDGRRSFAHWLDQARVQKIRIKMYMGHASGDVTDLYLRHNVEAGLKTEALGVRMALSEQWSAHLKKQDADPKTHRFYTEPFGPL